MNKTLLNIGITLVLSSLQFTTQAGEGGFEIAENVAGTAGKVSELFGAPCEYLSYTEQTHKSEKCKLIKEGIGSIDPMIGLGLNVLGWFGIPKRGPSEEELYIADQLKEIQKSLEEIQTSISDLKQDMDQQFIALNNSITDIVNSQLKAKFTNELSKFDARYKMLLTEYNSYKIQINKTPKSISAIKNANPYEHFYEVSDSFKTLMQTFNTMVFNMLGTVDGSTGLVGNGYKNLNMSEYASKNNFIDDIELWNTYVTLYFTKLMGYYNSLFLIGANLYNLQYNNSDFFDNQEPKTLATMDDEAIAVWPSMSTANPGQSLTENQKLFFEDIYNNHTNIPLFNTSENIQFDTLTTKEALIVNMFAFYRGMHGEDSPIRLFATQYLSNLISDHFDNPSIIFYDPFKGAVIKNLFLDKNSDGYEKINDINNMALKLTRFTPIPTSTLPNLPTHKPKNAFYGEEDQQFSSDWSEHCDIYNFPMVNSIPYKGYYSSDKMTVQCSGFGDVSLSEVSIRLDNLEFQGKNNPPAVSVYHDPYSLYREQPVFQFQLQPTPVKSNGQTYDPVYKTDVCNWKNLNGENINCTPKVSDGNYILVPSKLKSLECLGFTNDGFNGDAPYTHMIWGTFSDYKCDNPPKPDRGEIFGGQKIQMNPIEGKYTSIYMDYIGKDGARAPYVFQSKRKGKLDKSEYYYTLSCLGKDISSCSNISTSYDNVVLKIGNGGVQIKGSGSQNEPKATFMYIPNTKDLSSNSYRSLAAAIKWLDTQNGYMSFQELNNKCKQKGITDHSDSELQQVRGYKPDGVCKDSRYPYVSVCREYWQDEWRYMNGYYTCSSSTSSISSNYVYVDKNVIDNVDDKAAALDFLPLDNQSEFVGFNDLVQHCNTHYHNEYSYHRLIAYGKQPALCSLSYPYVVVCGEWVANDSSLAPGWDFRPGKYSCSGDLSDNAIRSLPDYIYPVEKYNVR